MTAPWLGIILVTIVLGAVMAGLKLVSARCSLHPETSRKAVHMVMGLVTLSFPWLFRESWPVLLLAGIAVTALVGTRFIAPLRDQFGGVLHGVARSSLGELYFPLAVAALFLLSESSPLLYFIPLLTLTLADAVAALVGVRYGQHRYATSEGTKSAEGSLAFFVVAFLSAHVPLLLLSNTGRAESLLIALMLGILVMLFEAVSVGGLDNLFIPLGCYALLRRYLALDVDGLLFRLAAVCLVALVVFAWRRRTTLKESGLLAAALVGYMNWALGGWQWLAVSLVLFLTYTCLWPKTSDNTQPVHTVRVVAAIASPGMVWLLALLKTNRPEYFYPFVFCYAASAVIIGMTQMRYACPEKTVRQCMLSALSRIWLLFLPLFFLPIFNDLFRYGKLTLMTPALHEAIAALPLLALTGVTYAFLQQRLGSNESCRKRWLSQSVIVLIMSVAEAALIQPMNQFF